MLQPKPFQALSLGESQIQLWDVEREISALCQSETAQKNQRREWGEKSPSTPDAACLPACLPKDFIPK